MAPSEGYVYLSDVHLGAWDKASDARLEKDLINILEYCRQTSHTLVILGDLFDHWMEYQIGRSGSFHCEGPGSEIRAALAEHCDSGGKVVFVTGNHDFWTYGGLSSLGLVVHTESIRLKAPGPADGPADILCLHGDGLTDPAEGLPRPLLHRILRHRLFVSVYQALLPPRLGLEVMKRFSDWTRKSPDSGTGRLDRWARARLVDQSLRVIICGHDHVARQRVFDGGVLFNSGAFFLTRTAVLHTKDGISLVAWTSDERRWVPFQAES